MRGGAGSGSTVRPVPRRGHLHPGVRSDAISGRRQPIKTSFLQGIGGVRHYKKMLPLMPCAGVIRPDELRPDHLRRRSCQGHHPRPDAIHICLLCSPMRYTGTCTPVPSSAGPLARGDVIDSAIAASMGVSTAHRVDHFIAVSAYVARRIERYYRRTADVKNRR
jgi:hypothetical protein